MFKQVKYLLPSTDINMGGIIVKQALPTHKVNQVDPFLLLHHGSFLVLAGMPLNEKVAQQGPYVMNSETEIPHAMRDYQLGKMGVLIEE